MPSRRAQIAAWAFVLLLAVASLTPVSVSSAPRSSTLPAVYTSHAPIVIEGDANFTASNGVVGGSGVWYDPYRIEGWAINASASDGVQIRNTTAHVVLQDLRVTECTHTCVELSFVANAAIAGSYLETELDPYLLHDAAGVGALNVSKLAIISTTLAGPGYGAALLGSSGVTIQGNRVVGDPNYRPFGGITVQETRQVTIRANAIGYHGFGAFFYGSSEINVSENRMWDDGTGLIFLRSSNATVFGNHLAWLGTGIRAENSQNLSIVENAVTEIHGGYPEGRPADLNHTVGAHIYRNDFWTSANPFDDMGIQNAWDGGYPTGGNWWGIEFAPDNCSGPNQDICPDPDGIMDAPFPFDANSTDRYPFLDPVSGVDLPPIPSFSVVPSSGDTDTTFALNASASRDLEQNWGLSYRWDWEGDGLWDTGWSSAPAASHRFTAPADYPVRLEVRDITGHTDNTTLQVSVLQAPDRQPPSLVHTPVTTAAVGALIQVNVTATDSSGVANVTLYYAPAGSDTYRSLRMIALTPPTYKAVIPASDVPGIVRYYIVAVDGAGNTATLPLLGTYNVTVLAGTAPDNAALYSVAGLSIAAVAAIGVAYFYVRRRLRARPPGNP